MGSRTKQPPVMPRMFRYEITEVDGSMAGRLKVGDVIVDRWKGRIGDWSVHDFSKRDDTYVGGWTGKLLGEVTEPDTIRQLCERHGWRPRSGQEGAERE